MMYPIVEIKLNQIIDNVLQVKKHCEENGVKLTLVTKVDSYEPNHGPAGDADGTVYFQGDEEISPEDGEALFEQYAGEDDVITYEELPE